MRYTDVPAAAIVAFWLATAACSMSCSSDASKAAAFGAREERIFECSTDMIVPGPETGSYLASSDAEVKRVIEAIADRLTAAGFEVQPSQSGLEAARGRDAGVVETNNSTLRVSVRLEPVLMGNMGPYLRLKLKVWADYQPPGPTKDPYGRTAAESAATESIRRSIIDTISALKPLEQ